MQRSAMHNAIVTHPAAPHVSVHRVTPQPAKSPVGAIVDWTVLTAGVLSLGFSVAATVLGGDGRLSDASAVQAQPVNDEL